jgi:hypothetical protein
MHTDHDRQSEELAVRLARADDASSLSRLGQLDVGTRYGLRLAALARCPEHGELLVAETDGALVAALDLRHDRVVADPFRPSRTARELLDLRARQLRRLGRGGAESRRGWITGVLPRAG